MTKNSLTFQKRYFYVSTLIILFITNSSFGQHLFDEKFEGCNTSHFVVESDSISVKPLDQDILTILAENFEKEVITEIRGLVSIQILVDQEGDSCVLSLENDTNIETTDLNIKNILDDKLRWTKPDKNKSVIVAIKFYGDSVELKRIGLNAEKGYHELLK